MEKIQIDLGERSLAVHRAGHISGGKPIVLLVHGFPLSAEMWSDVIPALSGDFELLVPDLRGFGANQAEEGPFSMADLAQDLDKLLTAMRINNSIALVGLSMGGYVAFEFQERFRHRLSKLVLCDTRAAVDSAEAAAGRLSVADRVLTIGTKAAVEAMLPRLVWSESTKRYPGLVARIESMMYATHPSTIAHAQRAMAARKSFVESLPSIDIPTQIIVGQHDVISTREEMNSMAEKIPHAKFSMISDCGHMPPMEKPQEFVKELVAFLK